MAARVGSQVRVTAIHPLGGGTIREVQSGNNLITLPLTCEQCDDRGEWVVQVGKVGDIDCKNLQNPLAGTCADGWFKMFECYGPSGKCTYDVPSGLITYENGAKQTVSSSGGELIAPSGQKCGSYTITIAGAQSVTINWTNASGQTWIQRQTGSNSYELECPGGEKVQISSEALQVQQACAGTNAQQQCETVGLPGSCSDTSQCPSGQICCPSISFCVPDVAGACPP